MWDDEAWRDPWVFQHPERGDFHAFITARVNYGPPDGRGVIGHARSEDLIHWEVLPPVTEPGDFGYTEVPQLVTVQGRHTLLFSVQRTIHSSSWSRRTGREPLTGVHYLVADNPLGPFRSADDQMLVADDVGSLYAGKLVRGPESEWVMLAARMHLPDGTFLGELSDPMRIIVGETGSLSVSGTR